MKTQAFFENIQETIIKELEKSQKSIKIAVAWFTDTELLKVLCARAEDGVNVEILLMDDEINQNSNIDFELLRKANGKLWFIENSNNTNLMHNKFCVIDNITIINGSYNWTNKAKSNHESITIIKDNSELIEDFVEEFEKLKTKYFDTELETKKLDLNRMIIRLNTLKNAILLSDNDDIENQILKINNAILSNTRSNQITNIEKIISLCKKKMYADSIQLINEFINKFQAIVPYNDEGLTAIKIELKVLEVQISSLEDEKAEIEKIIRDFEISYNREIGKIVLEILKLRQEKYYKASKDNKAKQEQYEKAKKEYEGFYNNYEITKREKRKVLSDEEKDELKTNFRKASKYCHPDVVAEQFKDDAIETFVSLRKAYDEDDLKKVRSILQFLEKGIFTKYSEEKCEMEELLRTVMKLRKRRDEIELQINQLMNSQTYQKIISIDDWDIYFIETREQLENQLKTFQEDGK